MDATFIEQQKKSLLIEKQRLEQELKKRGTVSKTDSEDYRATHQEFGDDVESNAAEYAQNETNTTIVEQLEDELRKVNAALVRIENGAYGIDAKTGKPIDKKRLEAYPAAETDI